MAPILDLLITLLSMGENGYMDLLRERKRLLPILTAGLQALCEKHQLSILVSPKNSISIGVSIESLRGHPSGVRFGGDRRYRNTSS
jgi:O-phospho-L-seryl-tRNASec:L-selenocysteinyl-tRNA synthase